MGWKLCWLAWNRLEAYLDGYRVGLRASRSVLEVLTCVKFQELVLVAVLVVWALVLRSIYHGNAD